MITFNCDVFFWKPFSQLWHYLDMASFPHTIYIGSRSWNVKLLCKDAPTQNHYWLHKVSAKIWCFPWKWSLVWQTLRFKPICHRMNRQWPHHLESQQLKAVLHMFKLCISSLQSNSKSSNGFSLKWHLHALKILLQFESPPGIRGTFMSPLKGESDSRA